MSNVHESIEYDKKRASSVFKIFNVRAKLWGITIGTSKIFRIRTDAAFYKILDFRCCASNKNAIYDIYLNTFPTDEVSIDTNLQIIDAQNVVFEHDIHSYAFGEQYEKLGILGNLPEYYMVCYIVINNSDENFDELDIMMTYEDLDNA